MTPAGYSPDVLEFIRLMQEHEVRYLLVGGEAVIHHGHARFTQDVDFFYDRSPPNVARLWAVLEEFWDGDVPVISSAEELEEPGIFLQYGRPPNRIDLISELGTVEFAGAWERRVTAPLAGGGALLVNIIGLDDLRQSKADAGRLKDLADIEALQGVGPKD